MKRRVRGIWPSGRRGRASSTRTPRAVRSAPQHAGETSGAAAVKLKDKAKVETTTSVVATAGEASTSAAAAAAAAGPPVAEKNAAAGANAAEVDVKQEYVDIKPENVDIKPEEDEPGTSYPRINLPGHWEMTERDKLLLEKRHRLLSVYKSSPYYLEVRTGAAGSSASDAAQSSNGHRNKESLSRVMKLVPHYFPEELYSATKGTRKRKQANNAEMRGKMRHTSQTAQQMSRIDELAQLEKEHERSSKSDNAAKQAKDNVENADNTGNDVLDMPLDDDDEDLINENDYYQGEYFDDDEGYDDPYDDGDEGAVY